MAEEVLQEINGYTIADRKLVPGFTALESGWFHCVWLLDLFWRVSGGREETAPTNATPTIFMATGGALRGPPIAVFYTIARPPGPTASPGANERS